MWMQCFLVGAVWGFTNALMKLADASYKVDDGGNSVGGWTYELRRLIRNWKWVLAFAANQSGSVLFYLTLRDADLSSAVPICQAMTLVFTVLGAIVLGEEFTGDVRLTTLGVLLISVGVALMRDS